MCVSSGLLVGLARSITCIDFLTIRCCKVLSSRLSLTVRLSPFCAGEEELYSGGHSVQFAVGQLGQIDKQFGLSQVYLQPPTRYKRASSA